MTALLHWFMSPEWSLAVKALLHTLWQGAAIALALGLLLRRVQSPALRYRCSLGALAGVLAAGIVTWSVLNRPSSSTEIVGDPASVSVSQTSPITGDGLPPVVAIVALEKTARTSPQWTAWIALSWLAGAILMLGRAGFQVAGAERLRRSTRPLEDSRFAQLLTEAKRAVRLTRTIRVAVTDKLTSPAVVGVLVPTLILPLSLVTTLSQEQLRFVLLHELAHIRRGDYFANLFQLFAEALLFFNPAVWWISHQMRREREACCDALAIELSGAPVDYAKTLVRVAENVLSPAPAAAPAFGDGREPSSLTDRVQRLLVPGYRPSLRLTWRAMLAALLVGGALLFLSAAGTRLTIAAVSAESVASGMTNSTGQAGLPEVARATNHFVPPAATTNAPLVSEARLQILHKLNNIRFDSVYYDGLPLSEVIRNLSDEARKRDPEKRGINFIINEGEKPAAEPGVSVTIDPITGLPVDAPATDETDIRRVSIRINPALSDVSLADVLNVIVSTADRPIKYSIQDFAIVFSFKSANPPEPLYTRTFKVDTNAFYRALTERAGSRETLDSTNAARSARALISSIGADLQPPKAVYFNVSKGTLLVRASLKDLDAIERLLQVINYTPPQVNIKVKFVEMPEAAVNAFYAEWFGTNRPTDSSWSGIMTRQQYSKAIQSFEKRKDTEIITGPEVTTLSGRQAQIQMVDMKTIVSGLTTTTTNGETEVVYETKPMQFGPVLDVIPHVSTDGYTIQLTAIPTVTEFLGYDDPKEFTTNYITYLAKNAQLPLPRFRVRQITTTASVWDGQTLVLGNFNDQVVAHKPDGNTQTNSYSGGRNKRLFVFLTPTLIDSAGNRIHTEKEMPSARESVPSQTK